MDLLQAIFQDSSVGLAVLNDKFELQLCNNKFAATLEGYQPNMRIGALLPDLQIADLANALNHQTAYTTQLEIKNDSKPYQLRLNFISFPCRNMEIPLTICELLIENDISELDNVVATFETIMGCYKEKISLPAAPKPQVNKSELALITALKEELEYKVEQRTKELSRAKQELAHQAHHDVLTGLANRRMFNEKIVESLKNAIRFGNDLAVLYLDLDKFKKINDALGHQVGDVLLVNTAERLTSIVRSNDTIARMGGDEFAIIIEYANKEVLSSIAMKINQALSQPFQIDKHTIKISSSIGICALSDISDHYNLRNKQVNGELSIVQAADVAMYEVKAQGKNNFLFFTKAMQSKVNQRMTMEASLKQAIDQDELVLHYQPKINLRTGEISGCEALVRWQHPEQGLLYPDTFIPLAEETGLVNDLGCWVMTEAFRQLKQWQADAVPIGMVAINLSGKQLDCVSHQNEILKLLAQSELPPQCIEFELTESVLMGHKSSSGIQFLELLGMSGYTVSMDDFGTGYSSLSYLRYLPVKTLKIDRSFVGNIMQGEQENALVLTIIAIAKTMGLKIVAEGIETKEQLAFLNEHHCDEGQGYYFSKPVSAKCIEEFARATQHSEIT